MIRGTTPTLYFEIPFQPDEVDRFYITFSQFGKEVFSVSEKECSYSENVISVKLTQEQTLNLCENHGVRLQIRLVTKSGNAMASDIIQAEVNAILKEGEI